MKIRGWRSCSRNACCFWFSVMFPQYRGKGHERRESMTLMSDGLRCPRAHRKDRPSWSREQANIRSPCVGSSVGTWVRSNSFIPCFIKTATENGSCSSYTGDMLERIVVCVVLRLQCDWLLYDFRQCLHGANHMYR